MKLTNRFGMPDIIVRALTKRDAAYSKAGAKLSVTQLISPPRISTLKANHHQEMEEDVSDRFWALLGTAVHSLIEDGATTETVEERLHAVVNGWEISGAIDCQEEKDGCIAITDYKVTNVMKIMKGDYKDWEAQLNIHAWLVRENKDIPVNKLTICAIARDWTRSNVGKEWKYPVSPITIIDLPLWDHSDTEEYLKKQVKRHQEAELAHKLGMPLPECTSEERWERPEKWALMNPNGKRAVKLYDYEEEANAAARGTQYVEHRPGEAVRCAGDYCGVSKWCDQWKARGK